MSFFRLTVLAAALSTSSVAAAADWTVCASGCDYSGLQAAVNAASADDTLLLSAETYLGRVVVNKPLSILGPVGGYATLDADGGESALKIKAQDVFVSGVEITGTSTKAGLVITQAGAAEFDDVRIVGNDSLFGGALIKGDLVADMLVVGGNSSNSYFAGGVNVVGGSADISGATFLDNHGYNGGALANLQGTVNIYGSSFTGNSAYLGGALHNSLGQTTLDSSSFSSNDATALAGGWSNHNLGGTVTVTNVGYAANTTGSGLYVDCYDVNGGCTP